MGNRNQAVTSFHQHQRQYRKPLQSRILVGHSQLQAVLMCVSMLAACGLQASAQNATETLTGRVRDESGAAVLGARVELRGAFGITLTSTANDGRFKLIAPTDPARLVITAPGFAVFTTTISQTSHSDVEVVLLPAVIQEQVIVTASRTETTLASTASSVRVLSAKDLSTTAAPTIDDGLRQVPGFQLFRRAGSRTANPTAQGVSLRGVGASGASRALVLLDGIPFADPFGGWIYWDRVPRVAINQVEIVRGGISDLYGSNALSGVINLRTRTPETLTVAFEGSLGNQDSPFASVHAGTRIKNLTASVAGEISRTDGYINVRKIDRGTVDTPVASRHESFVLELAYSPSKNSRLFFKPSYFAESRANGTPLQTNRTHIAEIDSGASWSLKRVGELSLRSYVSTETYDQNFSAIATNRNSETLSRIQRVPVQAAGLIFQWARSLGERQNLVGGFEVRDVRGTSDEIVFAQGNPASLVGAGGRQRSYSLFFRDSFRLSPRFSFSIGGRVDFLRDTAGVNVTRSLTSTSSERVTQFPDRSETALSPQVSVLYGASERLALFGSFYRAFRAPTLNELYRSFRVGNVFTLSNENLIREELTGTEGGARLRLMADRLDVRAGVFAAWITDPIANVTIATTPSLITRQRQNLGSTRSFGVEIDSDLHLNRSWNISAGYLLSNAIVTSFSANPALEGLSIPQTPRHSFTFQTSYTTPKRYRFGLQGRFSGHQFEDDQNLLALPGFFTLDAYASRTIHDGAEIFVAGENILNSNYELGRTPVVTVGPGMLIRAGLKLNFNKRK